MVAYPNCSNYFIAVVIKISSLRGKVRGVEVAGALQEGPKSVFLCHAGGPFQGFPSATAQHEILWRSVSAPFHSHVCRTGQITHGRKHLVEEAGCQVHAAPIEEVGGGHMAS